MTNRQRKWTTIAVAYETGKRTKKQTEIADLGLCDAAYTIGLFFNFGYACEVISLIAGRHGEGTGYWWATSEPPIDIHWTRQCDYERAFFAYLMAAISDAEYEEMVK